MNFGATILTRIFRMQQQQRLHQIGLAVHMFNFLPEARRLIDASHAAAEAGRLDAEAKAATRAEAAEERKSAPQSRGNAALPYGHIPGSR
jgi:hypothetical protein